MVTKLQADTPPSSAGGAFVTLVTGYDNQSISLNGQAWHESVLLLPDAAPLPAPCPQFKDLTSKILRGIRTTQPQLLIVGTGRRGALLRPELAAALMGRSLEDEFADEASALAPVGVESMDTQAACRTYNLLVTEGRRVAALFFLGESEPHEQLA